MANLVPGASRLRSTVACGAARSYFGHVAGLLSKGCDCMLCVQRQFTAAVLRSTTLALLSATYGEYGLAIEVRSHVAI